MRKIKVTKSGPYIVSGSIPLSEKIIVSEGKGYIFKEGRPLPQGESYALCRCGKTKNPPFCDGSHIKDKFDGEETASKAKFMNRLAEVYEGTEIDILDDGRCAFARFCHREKGNIWELVDNSDNPECRKEAITAANDCVAGRLVVADKAGNQYITEYEPAIEILQDPQKNASGPIAIKGNIPLEAADGIMYETRSRAALCRCGKSSIKPFCDATHIVINYSDNKENQ